MKIYFAGAIRGGRNDAPLYYEIVRQLQRHGEVLTEHVADSELGVLGQDIGDENIHDRDLAWLKSSAFLVAEVLRQVSASAMRSRKRLNGVFRCFVFTGQRRVGLYQR